MPKHKGRNIFGIGVGALSIGAVASAAAGGWKIAEFVNHAKKLHEVAEENAVFVRLVHRVRLDLAEVERLLHLKEVKWALSRSPKKVAWIRGIISSTRKSIEEMGEDTERVSDDTEKGKHVGLRHRLKWVLDEKEKLQIKQLELQTCHQGLIAVLGFLSGLEPLACCIQEEQVGGAYEVRGEAQGFRPGFEDPLRRIYEQQQREWYGQAEERGEGTIRVHEEKRTYGEEVPERETVRGREERSYERDERDERDGPKEATIRVHEEKRTYGREEPRREFVRSHHERHSSGRDEPRETIRVREKTSYGWEDDERSQEGIRLVDNDQVNLNFPTIKR
jgi:hypothetical protein